MMRAQPALFGAEQIMNCFWVPREVTEASVHQSIICNLRRVDHALESPSEVPEFKWNYLNNI